MKRKQEPRWDDRVAITFCLLTWLAMGIFGLYMHGWSYVSFLLG